MYNFINIYIHIQNIPAATTPTNPTVLPKILVLLRFQKLLLHTESYRNSSLEHLNLGFGTFSSTHQLRR